MWLLLALACGRTAGDADKGDVSDGDDSADTTPSVAADEVVATCADGKWVEPPNHPNASIADAKASFNADDPGQFLIDALEVRYPVGSYIFENGAKTTRMGDCLTQFTSGQQRRSAAGMLEAASTLVHECGHMLDIDQGGFAGAAYVLTPQVTHTCSGGSYNDTPPRSLIQDDAWASRRPACPKRGDHGCDSYAQVYLDGDPENAQFESGDQGLDTVLEESVQYINSLATDWVFADRITGQVSARDGILTFLWYVERYLNLMRTTTPRAYQRVLDDPCWRTMILQVWGRAWHFLALSEDDARLGIDADDLMELVKDPDLLQEIQRVRDADGC